MTVELQAGIERRVPKALTPLEKEFLSLLDERPWSFATAEQFDAVLERHSRDGKKPSGQVLIDNLTSWGYAADTSLRRPGMHTYLEHSITEFGSKRLKE